MSDLKIKVFLTDLDGCLTDGCYYQLAHQPHGIPVFGKKFNTRDWHGMMLLANMGVKIGIITNSKSDIIEQQTIGLRFDVVVEKGVCDKKKTVEEKFVQKMGIKWEEIAYCGDDLPDMELLSAVGVATCPADAEDEVLTLVRHRLDGYILERVGGNACVREFANHIRSMNEYNDI